MIEKYDFVLVSINVDYFRDQCVIKFEIIDYDALREMYGTLRESTRFESILLVLSWRTSTL